MIMTFRIHFPSGTTWYIPVPLGFQESDLTGFFSDKMQGKLKSIIMFEMNGVCDTS